MSSPEARDKFNEADALYREAEYEAALAVLKELDREFPGEQNILYPMARCLTKLFRDAEALRICDELIEKYQYGKAKELRSLIYTQETAVSPAERNGETPNRSDFDTPPESERQPRSSPKEETPRELEPTVISRVLPGVKPARRPMNPWAKTTVVSAVVVASIVTGYVVLFG